ncbi:MAG: cell division protein FtsQ/DivIB [Terriglobia bacterium]
MTRSAPINRASGPDSWDNGDSTRYHRPRRPIEVRRQAGWKRVWRVSFLALLVAGTAAVVGGGGLLVYRAASAAEVFRLRGLGAVDVVRARRVPANAVREHFAADVGQSVLEVPLQARRHHLEEMGWVETATVQRLWPNRLRVYLQEREPVAFLRRGSSLWLIDGQGVILSQPEGADFSFPVLTGFAETLTLVKRHARVRLYLEFLDALGPEGANDGARLSEIDLSDPDNIRASIPEPGGIVWLHFGRGRYREKLAAYLEHRVLWQQSGEEVWSVDLRYRGQIVLNPDSAGRKASR